MCKFFSCVSDGKGEVLFFTPEEVVQILASGNKEDYTINSHTSLMKFKGIGAKEEEKWNKWEYDPDTKELVADAQNVGDDSKKVRASLEKFFTDKDVLWLRNLYGMNAGSRNAGSRNAGSRNAGSYNAGSRNAGSYNAGWYNAGSCNAGSYNAGCGNAGSRNAGSYNAGWGNASDGCAGAFNTETNLFMFNKPCTKADFDESIKINMDWFSLTQWIPESDMTKAEKEANEFYETMDGYLKTIPYKEAWSKCPAPVITAIKKLANFDPVVFEEITGVTYEC